MHKMKLYFIFSLLSLSYVSITFATNHKHFEDNPDLTNVSFKVVRVDGGVGRIEDAGTSTLVKDFAESLAPVAQEFCYRREVAKGKVKEAKGKWEAAHKDFEQFINRELGDLDADKIEVLNYAYLLQNGLRKRNDPEIRCLPPGMQGSIDDLLGQESAPEFIKQAEAKKMIVNDAEKEHTILERVFKGLERRRDYLNSLELNVQKLLYFIGQHPRWVIIRGPTQDEPHADCTLCYRPAFLETLPFPSLSDDDNRKEMYASYVPLSAAVYCPTNLAVYNTLHYNEDGDYFFGSIKNFSIKRHGEEVYLDPALDLTKASYTGPITKDKPEARERFIAELFSLLSIAFKESVPNFNEEQFQAIIKSALHQYIKSEDSNDTETVYSESAFKLDVENSKNKLFLALRNNTARLVSLFTAYVNQRNEPLYVEHITSRPVVEEIPQCTHKDH